jgi:hypothetical protein
VLQHRFVGFHREADVVSNTVLERQQPGEDRCVRGQRLRNVRIRPLEEDAVSRQRINRRRADLGVAVGRQSIRPQRIDRDQDDRSFSGRTASAQDEYCG